MSESKRRRATVRLEHSEACALLREQMKDHQRQFIIGAWVSVFFAVLFALPALLDAMPRWQGVLAVSAFMLLSLWCWLRGSGRLGVDMRAELERWIETPSQVEAYDSRRLEEDADTSGDAEIVTGGPARWRIRFYLSDGRRYSTSVSQGKKALFIQALRVVFPEIQCRRRRK